MQMDINFQSKSLSSQASLFGTLKEKKITNGKNSLTLVRQKSQKVLQVVARIHTGKQYLTHHSQNNRFTREYSSSFLSLHIKVSEGSDYTFELGSTRHPSPIFVFVF